LENVGFTTHVPANLFVNGICETLDTLDTYWLTWTRGINGIL